MKWSELALKNISDFVATCIVLHNLCFINNKESEDNWIIKEESKLARRGPKEESWEDNKLWEKNNTSWSEKTLARKMLQLQPR